MKTGEPESNLASVFKQIQAVLGVIGASVAVIAASGFMVYSSHIGTYTDIPIIGVPVQYHIVAGLILAIHLSIIILTIWGMGQVFTFVDWIMRPLNDKNAPLWKRVASLTVALGYLIWFGYWLRNQPDLLLLSGFFCALHALLVLIFARSVTIEENMGFWEQVRIFAQQPATMFSHVHKTAITLIATFLYLAFYTTLIASVYGSDSYGNLPSVASGGQPATVSIIFYDNVPFDQVALPMESQNRTETVCLIASTNDTYVMYVPISDITVTIPRQSVFSIIDDSSQLDCTAQ